MSPLNRVTNKYPRMLVSLTEKFITSNEEVLGHVLNLMVCSVTKILNRQKTILTFISNWNARHRRSWIWIFEFSGCIIC